MAMAVGHCSWFVLLPGDGMCGTPVLLQLGGWVQPSRKPLLELARAIQRTEYVACSAKNSTDWYSARANGE